MQNSLIELNLNDQPAITGTDVTVVGLLEELDLGESIEHICCEHQLTKEQVHAALSYAEMNLLRPRLARVPYTLPASANDDTFGENIDDELDYLLLAENAGYFSTDACSFHLLHRFKKRVKPQYASAGQV